MPESFTLSHVDEMRFGVRTAKAFVDSPEKVRAVLAACHAQEVRLAILRIPVHASATVVASERAGALLMDTLCYYEIAPMCGLPAQETDTSPAHAAQLQPLSFRLGGTADAPLVEDLARDAFQGYPGHYQNDANLRVENTAEVYPSWARSCCEQASDDQPLVIASQAGQAVGFAAMKRNDAAELEVALFGVRACSRGRGVAAALLDHLLRSCASWGGTRLIYSTQLTNVAMQRLLAKAGFVPTRSFYTFHHWIDLPRS